MTAFICARGCSAAASLQRPCQLLARICCKEHWRHFGCSPEPIARAPDAINLPNTGMVREYEIECEGGGAMSVNLEDMRKAYDKWAPIYDLVYDGLTAPAR